MNISEDFLTKDRVLDQIVSLWNVGGKPDASQDAYQRNTQLPPEAIRESLLEHFSIEDVSNAVSGLLSDFSDSSDRFEAPSKRMIFLSECCLRLAVEGVPIPPQVAQKVVRQMPLTIWYRLIRLFIPKCLTRFDLLNAFREGLYGGYSDFTVENCVAGICMYQRLAKKDPNAADSGLRIEIERKLMELTKSQDPDIAQLAAKAGGCLLTYAD